MIIDYEQTRNQEEQRMKIYMDDRHLRMVGKSWQIRAKLKELSRSSLTVQQFLQMGKEKKRTTSPLRLLDK
jgi:hypothetical protein